MCDGCVRDGRQSEVFGGLNLPGPGVVGWLGVDETRALIELAN